MERFRVPRRKVCAGGLPPKVIGALGADVRDLIERSCDRIRFRFAGGHPYELECAARASADGSRPRACAPSWRDRERTCAIWPPTTAG